MGIAASDMVCIVSNLQSSCTSSTAAMQGADIQDTLSTIELVLTEPPHNFLNVQTSTAEIVLEEFRFHRFTSHLPASFIPWRHTRSGHTKTQSKCQPFALVIDSGFSFTHAIPLINGVPLSANIRRLDIGGKLLTNALKEMISYRHFDMMDEFHLVNQIKEQCCFVTLDLQRDLDRARNGELYCKFVLPDLSHDRAGYVMQSDVQERDGAQILQLTNEMFMIPELLFRPQDIGITQMGVAAMAWQAIEQLGELEQMALLDNVVLIGGSVNFPGFEERFMNELRSIVPDKFDIRCFLPENPSTFAARCGVQMLEALGQSTSANPLANIG